MLPIVGPKDLNIKVLGIDPGTQNLGYNIGNIIHDSKSFVIEHANTLDVYHLIHNHLADMLQSYSRNIVMYRAVYNFIQHLIRQYNPDWVICESPYMNSRFPLPYALLTLCTQAIEEAVKDYSSTIIFEYIDPATVKKTMGVKGNSGDKNQMLTALSNNKQIQCQFDLSIIDEHAIDSIAIGYTAFKQLF